MTGFPNPISHADIISLPAPGSLKEYYDRASIEEREKFLDSIFKSNHREAWPRLTVDGIEFAQKAYRRSNGKGAYVQFYVVLLGKEKVQTRQTFAEARKAMKAWIPLIKNGQTNMASMQEADRSELLQARENLKDAGKGLLSATQAYADMHRRATMGGVHNSEWTVERIFEIGIAHRAALDVIPKNIPEVVSSMLSQMEKDGSGKRWIDDLESRLGKFVAKYTGQIAELRAPAINQFLDGLNVGPRSRNNYRIALMTLFSYAKERNYLPRNWCEMDLVKRAKVKKKRILIYSPDEMAALIDACRENLLAFLTIQGFAGVRTREIMGDDQHPPLDWGNIDFEKKEIKIPADVAKEGTSRRIIPMSNNLVSWLDPIRKEKGPICIIANTTNALRKTAERAGIKFLRNALRKSFISYRQAVRKDIGAVAREAGNSPDIIKEYYEDVRSEHEGIAWFRISRANIQTLITRARQLSFAGL